MGTLIRTIYFWVIFVLLTIGAIVVVFAYKFITLLCNHKDISFFVHFIANLWGNLIFKLIPFWNLHVDGKMNLPKKNELGVIVANHASMTDILAIHCLGINFRWISKDSIFKIPGIGQCMRWAGYVAVKRGVKSSHNEALYKASEILSMGICMLFFPEGTRSETGQIRPFKLGAFKLAFEHSIPIFPIVLKGTRDLIPKKSVFVGKADVRIICLPKVYKLTSESIEEFAIRVRNDMIKIQQDYA